MTGILNDLIFGMSVALTPNVLIYAVLGYIVGTLVGVLPGLGPLAGMSLLLPLTFGLPPTTAIVLLAGIYYGAMYGGSTTSILMRIPGETASVVTCLDGYEMARKGRAGPALAIAAIGSFIAGTISVFILMLVAPQIARFALKFGPAEYVGLLTLGLLSLSQLSSGSRLRALLMSLLGLSLGMIGIDPLSGYARFTFGIHELADGLGIVPLAVGGFGISEILLSVARKAHRRSWRRA
jgi:putative tricarboxylic transport membrane protein